MLSTKRKHQDDHVSEVVCQDGAVSTNTVACAESSEGREESCGSENTFADSLPDGFWCPPRLRHCNEVLIHTVRDFHVAMLNDHERHDFYRRALQNIPVCGKQVLDLGAGTGLLSLIAARLGAKSVVAIEGSSDMASVARENVERNHLSTHIRIIQALSSDVELDDSDKADVIVSETFGSLLLTEGCLDYFADARRRLLRPGGIIVPARGCQFVTLFMCPSLAIPTSITAPDGSLVDCSAVGLLKDTCKMSKSMNLSSVTDFTPMSERIPILDVDFCSMDPNLIRAEQQIQVRVLKAGRVDGALASWEIFSDANGTHRLGTHLEDLQSSSSGFSRDVHWGPMVQFIEDFDEAQRGNRSVAPRVFTVEPGEELRLTIRFSEPSRECFQVLVQRSVGRAKSSDSAASGALPDDGLNFSCPSRGVRPPSPNHLASGNDGPADEICNIEASLPSGFWCPPRLRGRNEALVEEVNGWHAAALRDVDWNTFIGRAMASAPVEGKKVLLLRAGTGVLATMAAKLGASHVTAIESLPDLVDVARATAACNDVGRTVRIIRGLSGEVRLRKKSDRAEVVLLDSFGSLLLSEGCLHDLAHARRHLARPGAKVIPSGAAQFAVLVSSPSLRPISALRVPHPDAPDIDLSSFARLHDTASMCSATHGRGFHLDALPDLVSMSPRVCLFSLDLQTAGPRDVPLERSVRFRALRDGQVDAVVASWELWAAGPPCPRDDSGPERRLGVSTHLEDGVHRTPSKYARSMHWGQALQLVEDIDGSPAAAGADDGHPVPFRVHKDEELQLMIRFSRPDRRTFQATLRRMPSREHAAGDAL